MKVHRYSEQQRRKWVYEMSHKLKSVKQICNEAVISRATLYNWIKEFSNNNDTGESYKSSIPEATASIAWEPLDKHKMLLASLGKIDVDKKVRRKLVSELIKRYTLTVAQACDIAGLDETDYNYKPRKPEVADRLVYDELLRLIAEDTSRVLEDCSAILQKTHPGWTRKQIKRIYRQGRLYLNRTRVRNTRLLSALVTQAPVDVNTESRLRREAAFWQVGMIQGNTTDNTTYWLLYIIDYNDGTPLNAAVGEGSLTTESLIDFLTTASKENGAPKKMRVIAQPPFNSRELTRWVWDNKVALYNLSMAKPENQLETGHLEDGIKQQLLEEILSVESLKEKAESWVARFVEAALPV